MCTALGKKVLVINVMNRTLIFSCYSHILVLYLPTFHSSCFCCLCSYTLTLQCSMSDAKTEVGGRSCSTVNHSC
jgi:hypothetical protein